MRRFWVFLVISALFLGQGFSVAAAICHHRDARDHAMARQSRDPVVAAAALGEETAASVVEKKGALAAGSLSLAVAVLAPALELATERHSGLVLAWSRAEVDTLEGSITSPLLRPPLG
jgi:hypothetical protein